MSRWQSDHDVGLALDRLSRRAAARPIGPVRIGDDVALLRQARWSDGPAWVTTRRRDGQRIRSAFGPTSLTIWVEYFVDQRRAVRAGRQVSFLAISAGGGVIGEVAFHLDAVTGSAEISLWFARGTSPDVTESLVAGAVSRLFGLPAEIARITAPIAVTNPGPRRLLARLGFTGRAVSRQLRRFDGQWVDHDIWWLDRPSDDLGGPTRAVTDPTA